MQIATKTPVSEPVPVANAGTRIILGLFGTPFALLGTFALIASLKDLRHGKPDAMVGVIVGAIFMIIGGAIIVAAFKMSTFERRKTALQIQYPDEPWRWSAKWVSGKISDDSATSALFFWAFALFWNLISLPTFGMALVKGDAGNAIWLIALFPLVGLGLIATAFYVSAQRYKYGPSTLDLETFPGRVGGWIAGTIQTATLVDTTTGVQVTLKCVNRVTTNSGKDSSTSEYPLWQKLQTLSGEFPRAGTGLGIPVAFQIPPECLVTRDDNRNAIVWRLVVTVSEPGIDFKSTFTVPVFAMDGASAGLPKVETFAAKFRQPEAAMTHPHDAHISIEKDTAGRELIDFPPGRNLAPAIFLTVMAAFFGGVGIGIGHVDGPGVLAIIFQIVGGLCALGAATTLLKGRSIHVLQDAVELRWRMLGLGGAGSIRRGAISSINYQCNSSVGSTMYYQLLFTTTSGDVVAASGLKDEDAKWIAADLSKTLGISNAGETMSDIRRKLSDRIGH